MCCSMKIFFLLSLCLIVHSERTKDKMYESIDGISACFRRLNGTHQVGCSSKRGGSTGVVHFIESRNELNFVLSFANGLDYIPVIPIDLFSKDTIIKLQSSTHISGLLIYNRDKDHKTTLSHYSPEAQCPNEGSNIPGTCSNAQSWNPNGSGLLQEDFNFPLFYLDQVKDINKVQDCFNKFNNYSFNEHPSRSLCSLELKSFMFAAYNTPTCLRRSSMVMNLNPVKFCDPLGDQNVYASLFPMGYSTLTPDNKLNAKIKQILVVSRIDTTSLFYTLEPGAEGTVTGMVTLLSVAELLKRMLPTYNDYDRNVIFILFNGESYDYLGSQRVVYDMKRDNYPRAEFTTPTEHAKPVRFQDIVTIFEISQIRKSNELHLHMLNETEHQSFLGILKKNLQALNVNVHNGKIPPTSIQSFAREKNSPPSLVMTDYADKFSNNFYNGMYDDVHNLDFVYQNMTDNRDVEILPKDSIQVYIGDVVDGIAKSLYEAVTKAEYKGDERANLYYVNELLHCYLESANCSIHRALRVTTFQPVAFRLYVSVSISNNIITKMIALTLAYFVGDKISAKSCPSNMSSQIYYHLNITDNLEKLNETSCYRISMNLTDAESPAFLIDDYDWMSGQYSSWTESVWRDFDVRLFLKPARSHEIMTLVVGLLVFLVSILITYWINQKRDVLFAVGVSTTSMAPANC